MVSRTLTCRLTHERTIIENRDTKDYSRLNEASKIPLKKLIAILYHPEELVLRRNRKFGTKHRVRGR